MRAKERAEAEFEQFYQGESLFTLTIINYLSSITSATLQSQLTLSKHLQENQ